MIRTGVILSFLLMIIISTLGCVYAVRYDGPYRGKVIDAETREPLEGVVVLGVWYREYHTPAGAVHKFYDAKETVTDKNGEFSILGLGLRVITNVIPMHVMIFKAGYDHVASPWDGLKNWGYKGYEESYDPVKKTKILREVYDSSKKIKFEDGKAIIPMKMLTKEERKKRGSPPDPPSEASLEKVRLMLKEIDKDRIERGLDPRGIWRGERYE